MFTKVKGQMALNHHRQQPPSPPLPIVVWSSYDAIIINKCMFKQQIIWKFLHFFLFIFFKFIQLIIFFCLYEIQMMMYHPQHSSTLSSTTKTTIATLTRRFEIFFNLYNFRHTYTFTNVLSYAITPFNLKRYH